MAGSAGAGCLPLAYRLAEETLVDGVTRTRPGPEGQSEPAEASRAFTYEDAPTGLSCRVELREFREFGAVEWVVWLRNDGASDSSILDGLYPLDLRRPLSPFVAARFKLRGLEPEATYEVIDMDQPESPVTMNGRELWECGLTITMPAAPQAVVVTYRTHAT